MAEVLIQMKDYIFPRYQLCMIQADWVFSSISLEIIEKYTQHFYPAPLHFTFNFLLHVILILVYCFRNVMLLEATLFANSCFSMLYSFLHSQYTAYSFHPRRSSISCLIHSLETSFRSKRRSQQQKQSAYLSSVLIGDRSQSVDHRMWPGNRHVKNFLAKSEVIKSRSKGMLTTTSVGWSVSSHSSHHRLHLLQQSAELISEKVDLDIRVLK